MNKINFLLDIWKWALGSPDNIFHMERDETQLQLYRRSNMIYICIVIWILSQPKLYIIFSKYRIYNSVEKTQIKSKLTNREARPSPFVYRRVIRGNFSKIGWISSVYPIQRAVIQSEIFLKIIEFLSHCWLHFISKLHRKNSNGLLGISLNFIAIFHSDFSDLGFCFASFDISQQTAHVSLGFVSVLFESKISWVAARGSPAWPSGRQLRIF